ncbi:MAG: hypothetical protein JJ878_15680 [Alphaproteobacteria bacterium]|nr:hypothetical protein [Alphaproteobacteria bacterium]
MENRRESIAVLELVSEQDGFYTVRTAGLRNKGWLAKRKTPWTRSDPNTPTEKRSLSNPEAAGSGQDIAPKSRDFNEVSEESRLGRAVDDFSRLADKMAAVEAEVQRIVKQIAPEAKRRTDIDINGGRTSGRYYPSHNLIQVSLTAGNPAETARHETIHAPCLGRVHRTIEAVQYRPEWWTHAPK